MCLFPAWWSRHWGRMGGAGLLAAALPLFTLPSPPPPARAPVREVVLLISGGTQGHLEPCGCGGQRRGGLSGRPRALRELGSASGGCILVDAGDAVGGSGRQDDLKFQATALALRSMGYHAVALGDQDLSLDHTFLESTIAPLRLPVVCGDLAGATPWAPRYRSATVRGVRVLLVGLMGGDGAAGPAPSDLAGTGQALRAIAATARGKYDLAVVIAHRLPSAPDIVRAALPGPCVIILADSGRNEPPPPLALANCLVVDPGQAGRYLTRVGVRLAPSGHIVSFTYRAVPVTAPAGDGASAPAFLRLYRSRVAAEDLVGHATQRPLPDGERFVGSSSCGACHESQHTKWGGSAHAHAFSTLIRAGAEADPECVGCHTVGFGLQSGFSGRTPTPHLAAVGCEACHGPGGRHAADPTSVHLQDPAAACPKCHTPERSPRFDPAAYLVPSFATGSLSGQAALVTGPEAYSLAISRTGFTILTIRCSPTAATETARRVLDWRRCVPVAPAAPQGCQASR